MNEEKSLFQIDITPEDVREAAKDVYVEAPSSEKETVKAVVGAGNAIVDNYMRRKEGIGARYALNRDTVRVTDDLDGALGTYEFAGRNAGRTSLLRKYVYNPLSALAIYVHEATHKFLDKVLGYHKKLRKHAEEAFELDPLLGLLTMQYGSALNEGLTDDVRLKAVGENGITSGYQRNGFVGAARYALRRRGGSIRNLVDKLPESISDFAEALYNPKLQVSPAYA